MVNSSTTPLLTSDSTLRSPACLADLAPGKKADSLATLVADRILNTLPANEEVEIYRIPASFGANAWLSYKCVFDWRPYLNNWGQYLVEKLHEKDPKVDIAVRRTLRRSTKKYFWGITREIITAEYYLTVYREVERTPFWDKPIVVYLEPRALRAITESP